MAELGGSSPISVFSKMDQVGLAGCGSLTNGIAGGFQYYWQTASASMYLTSGCSLKGF